MFDSSPPNLPVEPAPKASPTGAPVQGGINQTGIKEPEDIFADIKEPELEQTKAAMPMQSTPTVKGFPWKVVFGIGIPLVVVGLGVSGWYVYTSYQSATKTVKPPTNGAVAPSSVPVTAMPDNTQAIPNPIKQPDETQLAASQAATALMQAQAAKGYQEGTTSTLSEATSTQVQELTATATSEVTSPPVAPPNIPLPESVSPTAPTELSPGLDSDQDGLTNSEEALLGTDPNKADSDGDGFADGSEVKSGYDPAKKNGKLIDSQYLKKETVSTLDVLIPTIWERKPGLGGSVQILTGTPAVITIDLQPYATQQTLLDWVVAQNMGANAQDFSSDKTASGIDVVYSKDRMTAWLLAGNTVYKFHYNTNSALTKDFGMIFEYIMVKQAQTVLP
ncbi:MAG: hypothetical protein PHC53_01400 [Patescibacteria group bacterium]|nr:hypothetical protein [Patescibacteria group bacterium]